MHSKKRAAGGEEIEMEELVGGEDKAFVVKYVEGGEIQAGN